MKKTLASLLSMKSFFLFSAYLRMPYDIQVALEAFLKESNVVGLMSSEEIVNVHLSYIVLKTKFSFQLFQFIFIPSFKFFTFYEFIEVFMTYKFKVLHFYK